jgi:RHS repeat-associated protein
LAIAVVLLGCNPASADWYYGWNDAVYGSWAGFGSGSTKYYSDEAALQAARAGYAVGYGHAWKHLEHTHDPNLLLSPFLPTVGYFQSIGAGSVLAAGSPEGVCQLLVAANNGSCSVTYAGLDPWLPASYLDYWRCLGNIVCTGLTYQAPLGYPKPYCPEDGYGYSGFGGQIDLHGRVYAPHICGNGHRGEIKANFDLGKCDDCRDANPVGNPISPALGVKSHQEPLIPPINQSSGLEWTWMYSSKMYKTVVKQAGWSHTYSRQLAMAPANLGPVASAGTVWAYRPDGIILKFNPHSGIYVGDADVADRLTRLIDASGKTSGWTYYVAGTDDTESYDSYGRITALQRRGGSSLTFTYSDNSTPAPVAPIPGLLIRVTDALGRQLNQSYDASGRLTAVTDPAGSSYVMSYDVSGNLISIAYPGVNSRGQSSVRTFLYENTSYPSALTGIVDEEGQRYATYTYDSQGRAISTEHAGGVDTYAIAFNADGSSAVTDPLGITRTFGYSLVVNAIKGTGISQPCMSCGDGARAKTYDGYGNVTSRSDFNNNKVCYAYDVTRNLETARVEGALASENCTTVLANPPSRPDVRRVTTAWSTAWRLPASITEPAPGGARTTTFSYDASGNLLRKSTLAPKNDGSGAMLTRSWTWTYGTLGRVITATDPNGNVTTYAYFPDNDSSPGRRGNLQSVTNPLGHVTQIGAYDANGRPLTIVDPNGLTTILTYDARGRLIDRNVGGERTTYSYDGVGQLTLVTMPDFSTLAYTYDAAHRLTQVQDGLGNRIVYTLDGMGNRTREQVFDSSNALARTRARTYDTLNRLAQDIGAQAQTTSYAYDNNGNLTSTSDPLRHVTGNTYDALNRLVQVLDPAGGATRYAYDGTNNLTQVTDPRGLATVYVYDGLGNLAQLVSPDTGTTASTFDSDGNLLTKVDARGVTSTYTVDALNRVASIVHSRADSPSETQTYTYDSGANARGRLTRLDDTAASTAWTYTMRGRVASKTQTTGSVVRTLAYGYNAAGQLASLTTPSGQVIAYAYANNRVVSVTVNGTALVTGIVAAPFGPAEGWQWGNSEYTFRRFDPDGRLASWEFRNGRSVLRNDLDFDAAGRITAVSDPNLPANSAAYQYDVLDRLAVAQQGNPVAHTQQFAYDALGNRQRANRDGLPVDLYYASSSNQLRQMIGLVSPAYLSGATALTFAYNNANRMVRTQSSGVTLATYAVNGLGQRVQKTVGSTTTVFVYDEQGRLVGEYDRAGKLIQETVWLDDLPIATLRPTGAAGTPTPIDVYYVHADHLGSTRAVTRPSDNAIMWRWDNTDPFGANAANENPAGQGTFQYGLRFPGQYYDAETATHYNYFRDYDPEIGRYEQSDPIGLDGGVNAFGYVEQRPTSQIDPRGLIVWREPLPPPRYPNGNYDPGFDRQDGICTVDGSLGAEMNANPCIRKCCKIHDDCYTKYGCNKSSWRGNFEGHSRSCQKCNADAVKCIVKAVTNGCPPNGCN